MKYLKLIRYQNLILIAVMQLIVRFGFLEQIDIPLSLFYWQYTLLILATVLIAAGGYVINDIFDQEIDSENKPKKTIVGNSISENHRLYYLRITNNCWSWSWFYLSQFGTASKFCRGFCGYRNTSLFLRQYNQKNSCCW